MTWEIKKIICGNQEHYKKAQDKYGEAWRIQAKKDKNDNPALRLSQKPLKNGTLSKEGASRGGKNSAKTHAHIQQQLSFHRLCLITVQVHTEVLCYRLK